MEVLKQNVFDITLRDNEIAIFKGIVKKSIMKERQIGYNKYKLTKEELSFLEILNNEINDISTTQLQTSKTER